MGFPRFFGTPKPERIPLQDVSDQPVEASRPPEYQSPPYIDRSNSLKLTWNVEEQPGTEYQSETASLNASANSTFNDGYNNVPKLWNSIWLRTKLLGSFVVLFVVLFVVTIVLYAVSEKNHGLSAEDAARQYGWRYGPTAFLAVILSLWVQIDYSSKILTPWQEMRRGPTEATRSVLVDYISPPMLIVWWRAIKNRHWAVTASISGILLIQLATIFSTGLFVLEPTTLDLEDVPMAVKNSFNGSDFRLTNSSTTIDSGPSLLYYGSRVNGLAAQPGVDISRGLVVPDFSPSDESTTVNGTNYSAIVPGAEASFDCEYLPGLNATRTSLPWWSILAAFFVLNIETPSCNISNIIVGEGPDHNIYHQKNATQAYMAYFGDYLCDPGIDYSYYQNLPDPSNTTVDHRIVMTVADLRFTPYNPLSTGPSYIYVENLTVAVCKSGYTMGEYDVTYKDSIDGQSKSWTADQVSTSEDEIPGFSSDQLGAAVQSSLDETYLGTGGQDWVLTKQVPTFYQILSAMNGNVSIGHFMDYEKLASSATDAFKGISAELINKHMTKPSESTVGGSMLYQENRLWVRALSVGFMAGAFLLLAALTTVLLIFRPRNVVPSDPGSIGTTALILAESAELRSLLSGLGAARTREIKRKLSAYNFRSVISPGPQKTFTVVPTEHGQQTDSKGLSDGSPPQSEHWWVPSAARWWFQLLAITLPLVIIAVLEVIQRLSDRNNGFVDLGSGGFATTHGFATYIPAVVAFVVATMFTSMQLAICILSPWLALHRGSAPASRSLFLNLINRLAPHRIYLAFKNGNVGEVLIMVATFLAAWLPVLVSGLYVTVPATSSHTVSLAQNDLLDFKLNNLFYDDNLAGTIAGLIAYKGLAYPKWTYGDLAFNTLDATGVPTDYSEDTEVPFVAKMQATRPSLTCEVISPDVMKARWDSSASQSQLIMDDAVALNLTSDVPWMCESPRGNTTSLPWFQGFALPADGSPIYFGHASVLSWGDHSLYGNRATITDTNRGGAVSYAPEAVANWVGGYGCPSFAVTLGRGSAISHVSKKNVTTYDFDINVTSIVCSQYLEVVDTNVTLTFPSLGVISPHTPPVPEESTAEFLINELSNYTGPVFEFPLNNLLLTLTHGTGNVTVPAPKGSSKGSDSNQLDDFVQFLATTNTLLSIESLIGEENIDNLIAATNRLYKTYMPQAIDRNMRSTNLKTKISTPDSVAGNISPLHMTTRPAFPGRLRLKQEAAPKFALQAVLAFMVLCAIGSRLLLRDIEKLIPHNPCSIAGRAALFADGEVSTRKLVPYGAEWRSEAELSRCGVYGGWLFSLGWWESFGVYKYGVDIGWIDQGDQASQGNQGNAVGDYI